MASQTLTYAQAIISCSGKVIPIGRVAELAIDLVNVQMAATSDECLRVFNKVAEMSTPLIRTVTSRDPNDKVGSLGVSRQHSPFQRRAVAIYHLL